MDAQHDFDLQIIARGLRLSVAELRQGHDAACRATLQVQERATLTPVQALHPHGLKALLAHLPHRHHHAA